MRPTILYLQHNRAVYRAIHVISINFSISMHLKLENSHFFSSLHVIVITFYGIKCEVIVSDIFLSARDIHCIYNLYRERRMDVL